MARYVDRAKVATATTGTGTLTLGAADPFAQSFTAAGLSNGDVIEYLVEEGTAWEIGLGTYNAGTLTRGLKSSSTGSLLSLAGGATVSIVPTANTFKSIEADRWYFG
jgi:hypothetical protein